jgi:hypothetical protein
MLRAIRGYGGPPEWTAVHLRDCDPHDFVAEPYFKPELNHHFFRNYYSQESNNGGLHDGNTTPKAGRDQ